MKNTLLFLFTFLVVCNTHIFSQFNGFEWLNPKPQGNQLNDIAFFNSTDGVNEYRQAGKYDIDFNASQLASGVYFYKLQVGDFISTKKMTLIK